MPGPATVLALPSHLRTVLFLVAAVFTLVLLSHAMTMRAGDCGCCTSSSACTPLTCFCLH